MEISSKEDFKVAFDKIPDYKIRKEKVSFVVVESHIVINLLEFAIPTTIYYYLLSTVDSDP